MSRRRIHLAALVGALAGPLEVPPASAQLADAPPSQLAAGLLTAGPADVLPFAPGERLEYSVTMARLRLGQGVLAVEGTEDLGGVPVYRVSLEVEIKAPFIRLRDREVSWVATEPIRSLAFERHRTEGDREERIRFRFDQESRQFAAETWDEASGQFRAGTDPGASGPIPAEAIDEIAALYLLRTLSLEPGTVHRLDRYFDPSGNPIVFRVVGKDKLKVPAGKFEVAVVEPDIPALSPFRASSEPRIYITDDARRLIVKITTRTKAGTLTFYLKDLPSRR